MDRPENIRQSAFDVSILFPNANWGWGTADACNQLARYIQPLVQKLTVHSPVKGSVVQFDFVDAVVPAWAPDFVKGRLSKNVSTLTYLQTVSANRAISRLSSSSICWVYPPATTDFIKRAKDRGSKVVLEFINTHTSYSKAVLAEEYARTERVMVERPHLINEAQDDDRLSLADAVFTPGKFIGPSIRQYCKNPPVLMPASYGAPLRAPPGDLEDKRRARKFVFVGFDGFRKGLHVLLEAWARAAIDGELTIVGGVDPWIQARYGHFVDHRVKIINFSDDLDGILGSADVFVLPSIEEGDPLSTYLAASHGLAMIVTPVAGGSIAIDGVNATFVEHSNADSLAAAMVRLADDSDLFGEMRIQSYKSSLQFTWQEAAKRRHAELTKVFGDQ